MVLRRSNNPDWTVGLADKSSNRALILAPGKAAGVVP